MPSSKVSAKGWAFIPKELRRKYGLTPGTPVDVIDYGGVLTIVPTPADPIAAMYGLFSSRGGDSWTKELLDEHRRDQEWEAIRCLG